MKKVIFFTTFLFLVGAIYAQKKDTTVFISSDKYKVETNRFKDNWFVSLGVGTQMFYGDHTKQMKFGDRLTPAFDFSVGKWFTPGIAIRLAMNGYSLKGVSGWSNHKINKPEYIGNYQGFIVGGSYNATGGVQGAEVYGKEESGAYDLYKTKIQYLHPHVDVLFNLSNLIGGYNESRFYSFIPYAGLGWAFSMNKDIAGYKSHEVTANIGLLNEFRITPALYANLDVRGTYMNDRFDGQLGGRYGEGIFSATVGLTYKINRRSWDRSKTTIIRYDESELETLRARLRALQEANDKLQNQPSVTSETKTIIEKTVLAGPLLVTFPINQTTLSNEARVNLGFLAESIKQNPKAKFVITGYADKGTGSASINERLSKQRSEAVFNCLVNEFGVPASQIRAEFEGGVQNLYYNDPRLSRAVITRVE